MKTFCTLVLLFSAYALSAQVKIGNNQSNLNPNSLLELESTNKGLLLPRLTTAQINNMNNPPIGMFVFNSTDSSLYIRRDTGWCILPVASNANAKTLFWASNGNSISNTNIGRVDVVTNDGFLARGTLTQGADLTEAGAGTKLIWYPKKAAFRAGYVTGANWDKDSIGNYSFATGNDTKASGDGAIAIGSASVASGVNTFAVGANNTSSGNHAAGIGSFNLAAGDYATVIGASNTVAGYASNGIGAFNGVFGSYAGAIGIADSITGTVGYAFGRYNSVKGYGGIGVGAFLNVNADFAKSFGESNLLNGYSSYSFGNFNSTDSAFSMAIGFAQNLAGTASIAVGSNNFTKGKYATAIGRNLYAKSHGGVVTGIFNDSMDAANPNDFNPLNRIFQIGNGTAENARSNAMTVLQNGNVGVGTTTPVQKLEVNGSIRQAAYSQSVTVAAASVSNFVWAHNLGYQPIIMISLDQTGGSNCESVSFSYAHIDNNSLRISLRNNHSSVGASGIVRWIVVY